MDPHLPFFYDTLNERFLVELLPSLDEPAPGCESDHVDCDLLPVGHFFQPETEHRQDIGKTTILSF